MSLVYYDINNEYGDAAVWKMIENQDFFKKKLKSIIPAQHLKSKKRTLEWLSSRYLLYRIEGIDPDSVYKDEFGKPHVKDSTMQISISHSNGYAAIAHSKGSIGIDIQTFVSKIKRIQSKYTTEEEMQLFREINDEIRILHLIWTIKEAVFKLYGRKELPFKEGIIIDKVSFDGTSVYTSGNINKPNDKKNFKAVSRIFKEYCLSRSVYNDVFL
ncbi:MAG: 4'-phosphopantetheinyl transferase superfamily protein [Saprospiraceae bacterium]